MEATRKNYNMMDVAKFLSAILLVCAHTASERVELPRILDLLCSFYIITVPFFFIASAFLFFQKLENPVIGQAANPKDGNKINTNWGGYLKWSKRIGLMYLYWSLIYFCFVAINWYQTDAGYAVILEWCHKSVVFSTYPTIWFLPALWIAVTLVYVLRYRYKWSITSILIVSIIIYIFGSIEYSYHGLNPILQTINESYTGIMKTWRNGLFNGFVYASIGLFIASTGTMKKWKSLIGTCVFGMAFLVEAFVMKEIVPTSDANFLIMLVPFSYFFFNLICTIELPDSTLFLPLRKMSMLIFLSQRLFLSAIPSVVCAGCIAGPWDITDNGILALILVVIEVISFSFLIMKASERMRILKRLM